MIACADMKNVYNHASRPINRIDCALYQCVRVIPVPAWMLKLGSRAVRNLFIPQPALIMGVAPTEVLQDLVLCLIEPHEVHAPSLKTFKARLEGSLRNLI